MIRSVAIAAAIAIGCLSLSLARAQTPPVVAPAAKATVPYNEWLARTYVERALNQPAKAERDKVFGQIVAKVVIRSVFTASLTGPNMTGVAPTSQKMQVAVIDVWSIRDGKLYEHWDVIDWTSFLAQAGVKGLPAPFYTIAGVSPPG